MNFILKVFVFRCFTHAASLSSNTAAAIFFYYGSEESENKLRFKSFCVSLFHTQQLTAQNRQTSTALKNSRSSFFLLRRERG